MSTGSVSGSGMDRLEALDADDPLLGKVLDGRYRIEAVLGTGGVGVVYRAIHTSLNAAVAIKALHGHFAENPDLLRRFRREAQVLSTLSHPHIVSVSDYGIDGATPYIVMELLEGCSLADLIYDKGPPEPERALDIARSVIRGLAFAHARGVLHRDLKPANVFLQTLPDDPHHVKLLDFGLAKLVSQEEGPQEPTLTGVGTVLGTPTYMSPEQASGSRLDVRTDVYSAGVLTYELLCGRPPFLGETRPEVMRAHIVEPVPRLSSMRHGLEASEELEAWLIRALEKEPRDRFADGAEMLAALDAVPRPAVRFSAKVLLPNPVQRAESSSAPTLSIPEGMLELLDAAGRETTRDEHPPWWRLGSSPRRLLGAALLGVAGLGAGGAFLFLQLSPEEVPAPTAPAAPVEAANAKAAPAEAAAPEALAPSNPALKAPGPAEEVPARGEDEIEVAPKPPARNPFARGPGRALRPYWGRVRRGRELSRAQHRALRDMQKSDPADVRPSLVLARDHAHRGWREDAVKRYLLAFELDPSSRGDPTMLRDLLAIEAADGTAGAADALETIYGEEALPAARHAAAKARSAERQRLLALLARLEGPTRAPEAP